MIKLKHLIESWDEDDQENTDNAYLYFSIGQDGDDWCWIWDGNNVIAKKGGTHGWNFTHKVADRNFKGWYDTSENRVSVSFPDYEARKLSGRKPTVDDIPERLYQALIRKFGKRPPQFVVFENL